jgi:hypothetical protein
MDDRKENKAADLGAPAKSADCWWLAMAIFAYQPRAQSTLHCIRAQAICEPKGRPRHWLVQSTTKAG